MKKSEGKIYLGKSNGAKFGIVDWYECLAMMVTVENLFEWKNSLTTNLIEVTGIFVTLFNNAS